MLRYLVDVLKDKFILIFIDVLTQRQENCDVTTKLCLIFSCYMLHKPLK